MAVPLSLSLSRVMQEKACKKTQGRKRGGGARCHKNIETK